MSIASWLHMQRLAGPTPIPDVESDQPSPALWRSRTSLHVIAACAVLVMMQFLAPLLLPIVLSVMLFYMLDPIVDRLEQWHVPRSVGSIGVVIGLVVALAIAGTMMWPQIDSVLTKVPAGAAQLRKTFREQRRGNGNTALEKIQQAARAVDSAAAEAGQPPTTTPGVMRVEIDQPWRMSDLLWTGGIGAIGIAGQGVTVLFLTMFL